MNDTQTVRAILIRPDHEHQRFTLEVTEIPLSQPNCLSLDACYSALDCRLIGIQTIDDGPLEGHEIVFDEEGLFSNPPGYLLHDAVLPDQPLAGKLLIVRRNRAMKLLDVSLVPESVSALLATAYIAREAAYWTMCSREASLKAQYPDSIVMNSSDLIEPADEVLEATNTDACDALGENNE